MRAARSTAWIDAPAFALIARVRADVASRVLRRALAGRSWHGCQLRVREDCGRGGKGGKVYRVHVESLPPALREKAEALFVEPSTVLQTAVKEQRSETIEWQFAVIEPALCFEPGTSERAAAVAEIAGRRHWLSDGRRVQLSARTIYRWIDSYEGRGRAGLAKHRRADRGRARVHVSKRWDDAVPFPEETKAEIAAALTKHIRSLWAAGAIQSVVLRFASHHLAMLTREAGFDPGAGTLKRLCTVPLHRIKAERGYRRIAVRDKDRKAHADLAEPRIQRTREGLAPMAVVVADVHRSDVLHHRPDGSTYTPRLITFQDYATNRLFTHTVFPRKGDGDVRQEHVIEAFVAMVEHPEWGMPGALYIDNGGEFNALAALDDAFKLVSFPVQVFALDEARRREVSARRSLFVRALPYNAAAKPVEGAFGNLERLWFSLFPGWIGGDRMKKKTANVGEAPVPFGGDEEAFRAMVALVHEAHDTHPQPKALDGRSPRDAFRDAVEAGWRRTPIDTAALRWVFCREFTRTVRQGGVSFAGRRWTSPELRRLGPGQKVRVRVPIGRDPAEIGVLTLKGELVGRAQPDRLFPFLDPEREGAKEAAGRRKDQRDGIAAMRKDVDPIDLPALTKEVVSAEPPAPVPENGPPIELAEPFRKLAHHKRSDAGAQPRRDIRDDIIELGRLVSGRAG